MSVPFGILYTITMHHYLFSTTINRWEPSSQKCSCSVVALREGSWMYRLESGDVPTAMLPTIETLTRQKT